MEHADVRMIQSGNSLGLVLEALLAHWIGRKLRGQNLDRHVSPQPRVSRSVHLSHPARAQRDLNLIRPESCS